MADHKFYWHTAQILLQIQNYLFFVSCLCTITFYSNILLLHKDRCNSEILLYVITVKILNNRLMPEMTTDFRNQNLTVRTDSYEKIMF